MMEKMAILTLKEMQNETDITTFTTLNKNKKIRFLELEQRTSDNKKTSTNDYGKPYG